MILLQCLKYSCSLALQMASTPKRRRRQRNPPPDPGQPAQQDEIQQLVQTCMAATLPLVQEAVEKCITDYKSGDSARAPDNQPSDTNAIVPGASILADLAPSGISPEVLPPPTPLPALGIARPVGLGIDPKIKNKIFSNEYVKLDSLQPCDKITTIQRRAQVQNRGTRRPTHIC